MDLQNIMSCDSIEIQDIKIIPIPALHDDICTPTKYIGRVNVKSTTTCADVDTNYYAPFKHVENQDVFSCR